MDNYFSAIFLKYSKEGSFSSSHAEIRNLPSNALRKKWSFPLRISSVNVTKSVGNSYPWKTKQVQGVQMELSTPLDKMEIYMIYDLIYVYVLILSNVWLYNVRFENLLISSV